MRKIFLFINTVCLLSLVACSSAESESKDKKDTTESDSTKVNGDSESKEDEMSAKRKLLTSMIGKHKLNSISGNVGMNAMFDFVVKDGIWKGEGSANEGGEREGYDLEIGDAELEKLNSMCIVVSEDLTVSLEINGTSMYKIPFDEKLTELKIDKASDHLKFDEVLPKITAENNVINSWHYLLVRDDLSEAKMTELDIPGSFVADLLIIKVSENLNEFNVEMKADVCCDNAIYVFKK